MGYDGHGWLLGRVDGGSGMISSCVMLAAPWRVDVPRQSAPVSPPMMTTCLPVATIWSEPSRVAASPSATRLACGRNSIAW